VVFSPDSHQLIQPGLSSVHPSSKAGWPDLLTIRVVSTDIFASLNSELVSRQRGPDGDQRDQDGERVGPLVVVAPGVAGAWRWRVSSGSSSGTRSAGVEVEEAGDLEQDLHGPAGQRRVRAADQVRVDAEQVTQLPGWQPGVAQLGQARAGHGGPPLIHRGRALAMGRGGVIAWSWPEPVRARTRPRSASQL
jgi:hypothetical protein